MITLGIETSCDETAAAVLDGHMVLSNVVYSQIKEHEPFGGIVPEIASRAHVEKIDAVYYEAVKTSGKSLEDIELIAATAGPGLIGALAVGYSFAKGLALARSRPFTGVHHMEGHLQANYIHDPSLKTPYLALVVSGGHTELIDVYDEFSYKLVSRTRDDAAGEAFDKIGKIIGLGYPAGGKIGKLAETGNPDFLKLPVMMRNKPDFSFSGLKTAVYYEVREKTDEWIRDNLNDICASVQEAIVNSLVDKTMMALKQLQYKRLVLAGGVACNGRLREKINDLAVRHGFAWQAPEPRYCTDNAAMIAVTAARRHAMAAPASYDFIFPSGKWYIQN